MCTRGPKFHEENSNFSGTLARFSTAIGKVNHRLQEYELLCPTAVHIALAMHLQ
jgi:hypothetical protein